MNAETPTRRERYRQQTVMEIKNAAAEQLADGGAAAVSLNAIAKTMGVSPGALYRYFDNRDDLLTELVVDAYNDLADHLEQAADASDRRTRVRDVARAYRSWAIGAPNSYRLIFETTSGSGRDLAPERIVPASQRSMNVFLAALASSPTERAPVAIPRKLRDQLDQWGKRAESDSSTTVLYLALTLWSRLHGIVSLELGGHISSTGIDVAQLFDAEIRQLTT